MTEQMIDEQINRSATYSDTNWSNTQESEVGFPFTEKGSGPDHYKATYVRAGWHVCEAMRPVKGFRVYHDSTDADDECSVTAGKYFWDGAVQSYAGEVGVGLTISATNYLWINCLTGLLEKNTSAWPDAAEIPHIRIATIAVDGSDQWKIDDDRSDFRHEHTFQPHNFGRPQLIKYPITYSDISTAGLTFTEDILLLPIMGVVYDMWAVMKTSFVGCTTLTLDVGHTGGAILDDPDGFLDGLNMTAAADYIFRLETHRGAELKTLGRSAGPYDADGTLQIEALFTATVDNLDQLSAGQIDIYVRYGVLNATY